MCEEDRCEQHGSFFFLVASPRNRCIIHSSSTNNMHRYHYLPRGIHAVRMKWIAGVLLVLVATGFTGYEAFFAQRGSAAVSGVEMTAPAKQKPKTKGNQTFHPSKISANDLKLMANAVYGEARGEPFQGQVAIAAVILNRVKSPSFPDTPAAVIFEPRAFTAVADGQIWLTPNENARKAVQNALSGMDPTGGCTYYFNPVTATSKWIWSRPQVKKIGKHIFCR